VIAVRMSAYGSRFLPGVKASRPMSAMGHKQTLEQASETAALPTKADMRPAVQKCPLSARSGHALRYSRSPERRANPPAALKGVGATQASCSIVTATSPFAERRTLLPSTSATRLPSM
jgi:hypothetical protein